jgi:hypothetical protein
MTKLPLSRLLAFYLLMEGSGSLVRGSECSQGNLESVLTDFALAAVLHIPFPALFHI